MASSQIQEQGNKSPSRHDHGLKIPQQFKPQRDIFGGPFGFWVKNALKMCPDLTAEMLEPTQKDLELIALLAGQTDELGNAMANAIIEDSRLAKMLDDGLENGLASLDNPPQVLIDFLSYYENVPEWAYAEDLAVFLDESVGRGTPNLRPPLFLLDGVAMAAGFFVGANYPAVGQSLVATGSVASGTARMIQTMKYVDAIADVRNFVPHGAAIQASAKVRLAHGFARRMIAQSGQWDKDYYGEIISDFDNMIFLSGLMLQEDRQKNLSERALRAMRIQMKAVQYLLGAPKELVTMTPLESKRFFTMVVAHLDDSPETAKQVVQSFHENDYFRPDSSWQGKVSRELSFLTANLITRLSWGNQMANEIGLETRSWGIPLDRTANFLNRPPGVVRRMLPVAERALESSVRFSKRIRRRVGNSDQVARAPYKGSYGAFR